MKTKKGIIKEKKVSGPRITEGNKVFKSINDYYKYVLYISRYRIKGRL